VFISNIPSARFIIELKSTEIELNILLAVLWSSISVALMTIMAVSCSLAVNECNRSPVIVQKIMLRIDIDREQMKELKKMFSQFKVMKIGFSACGMYEIDLSFLCGIISGTFSYLIIFSQL
jgi:hypothetical protein